MNSPLWGLLEPILEFSLYQFGLYLENPSGYSFETPGQKLYRELNNKVNEILADNKISDKRGYFLKNYGSYLKQMGSMEQKELLEKFYINIKIHYRILIFYSPYLNSSDYDILNFKLNNK